MCATLLQTAPATRIPNPMAFAAGACAAKGTASCKGLCGIDRAAPAARQKKPAGDKLPIAISDKFVADILSPYKPHARYLKSAEITRFRDKSPADTKGPLVTAAGRFAIPESCYIDDTGHFNAVEFNICFNQLAYVMFGKCIEAGIMHRLRSEDVKVLSLPEYKRKQLPSMVIVSIESRYYKQLDSSDFRAELTIDKISSVGAAWFFFTSISFADAQGVKAKGSVVLAYSPTFTPAK